MNRIISSGTSSTLSPSMLTDVEEVLIEDGDHSWWDDVNPCRQLTFEDSDLANDNGNEEGKVIKRSTSWREGKYNKSYWEVTKTSDGTLRVVDNHTGEVYFIPSNKANKLMKMLDP